MSSVLRKLGLVVLFRCFVTQVFLGRDLVIVDRFDFLVTDVDVVFREDILDTGGVSSSSIGSISTTRSVAVCSRFVVEEVNDRRWIIIIIIILNCLGILLVQGNIWVPTETRSRKVIFGHTSRLSTNPRAVFIATSTNHRASLIAILTNHRTSTSLNQGKFTDVIFLFHL